MASHGWCKDALLMAHNRSVVETIGSVCVGGGGALTVAGVALVFAATL